jgi:hypothetical protein
MLAALDATKESQKSTTGGSVEPAETVVLASARGGTWTRR